MRRSVAVAALILVAAPASPDAQPLLEFKSREIAEGKNFATPLGAVLAVGESGGQASYRFDVVVPEARGITPEVALVYASTAGHSEYGWGWELTLPVIERDAQDGVPRYLSTETFRYRSGHSVARLVDTGVTTSDGWKEYREEIESTFSRYLYKANVWRVLRTDGTSLHLGTDTTSRRGKAVGSLSGTAAWLVRRIYDTHSNYAQYVYGPDAAGNAQLRSIDYNGNVPKPLAPTMHVEFIWTPHWSPSAQPPSDYKSGYKRVFGQDRLASIRVTAGQHNTNGNPAKLPSSSPTIRTTVLDYGLPTGQTMDRLFFLRSIQQDSLPPASFTYETPWPSGAQFPSPTTFIGATDLPPFLGHNENDPGGAWSATRSAMLDINADGRADLVQADWDCSTHEWAVWINDGPVWSQYTWLVPFTDAPDPCAIRRSDTFSTFSGVVQDLIDVTGDAKPDMVYRASASQLKVCPGNGSGFDACVNWADSHGYLRRDEYLASASAAIQDLFDFNGDGIVDRVSFISTGSTTGRVYLGTGAGWGATYTFPLPNCGYGGIIVACIRLTETVVGPNFNRRLVAETRDVNGDGLPDFLTTSLATGLIYVAWGYSDGFLPLTQLVGGPSVLGYGTDSGAGDYVAEADLVDVNADGLPDVVEMECSGAAVLRVRYNSGGTWDQTWRDYSVTPGGPGGYDSPCLSRIVVDGADPNVTLTRSQLGDITGDGIPDLVVARIGPTPPPFGYLVSSLSYRPPRAMTQVDSLSGNHSMALTYAPQNGNVPFAIHAPVQATRLRSELWPGEPIRNRRLITHYEYNLPAFDGTRRRFTGFAQVEIEDEDFGRTRTLNLGNSYVDSGLVLTSITANVSSSTDSVPSSKVNTYTMVPLGPSRTFPRLDQVQSFDGLLGRVRLSRYTAYDYTYGVVTAWTHAGWEDTPSDDVVYVRNHVFRNDSSFRLALPSSESVLTDGGVNLGGTRWYYDAQALGATPTYGDLTGLERERTTGTWLAVYTAKYEAVFGHIVQTTDPMGAATKFTYDTTHYQFPVKVEDDVGTVYKSFHALTGGVSDACGPQYVGTVWNCRRTEVDRFGRVTQTWGPNSVLALELLSTTTYADAVYPLQQCVTTRPGAADSGHTCEYRDAFGNPTQLRTLIEDTGGGGTYRVWETSYDAYAAPQRSELPRVESGLAYTHTPTSAEAWLYDTDYVRNDLESISHPREAGVPTAAVKTRRTLCAPYSAPIVELVDEDGNSTRYELDGFDRVRQVSREGGATDSTTLLAYNGRGEVVSIEDANHLVTSFDRNLLGWVVLQRDPDSTATTFTHNARGQLTRTVDPRGVIVDYTFDTVGRLTRALSSNEPLGVRHVDASYAYYSTAASGQLGRLASETSDSISYGYEYNPDGTVNNQTVTFGVHTGSMKFERTTGGRLSKMNYNSGDRFIEYKYNRDDTVAEINDLSAGTKLAALAYEDDGQRSLLFNDDGVDSAYSYDIRGRLKSIASFAVDEPVIDDVFTWTPASRLAQLSRSGLLPGGTPRPEAEEHNITYDSFGRVTQVMRDGNAFGGYTYDLGDRIQSFNDGALTGLSTSSYTFDKLTSRNTGETSFNYTYDPSGQVIQDQQFLFGVLVRTRSHDWDALGRYAKTSIAGGTSTTYYYTMSGELSRVIQPGDLPTTSDHLHLGQWARKDLSTGAWRYRVFLGPEVVAEIKGSVVEFPHRTLAGSVAAVTDSNGDIVRQEEFTPYGARHLTSGSSIFEQGFQGIRTDELLVAGHRVYDPQRGAWMSRDPLRHRSPERFAEDTRLSAQYGFAFADPYKYSDPTGLQPSGFGEPDDDAHERRRQDEVNSGIPADVVYHPLNPDNLGQNKAYQVGQVVIATGQATVDLAALTARKLIPFADALVLLAQGEREAALKAAAFDLAMFGLAGAAARWGLATKGATSFGKLTVGAAERAIPKFTRKMNSIAKPIAFGPDIDKIDILIQKFGGTVRGWRKMKTWTEDGSQIHFYYHKGIGRVGAKWDGFPDPF
jgi:RHS repeat-associated protein